MQITLNGIPLPGCSRVVRRFRGPAYSESLGGQGDVVRVRKHANDVGHLVAYFDDDTPGPKHLSTLSSDDLYKLCVEGDSGGPDFTSDCWIDFNRSGDTMWVFDGVKLPR